jgi:hypothetical protein
MPRAAARRYGHSRFLGRFWRTRNNFWARSHHVMGPCARPRATKRQQPIPCRHHVSGRAFLAQIPFVTKKHKWKWTHHHEKRGVWAPPLMRARAGVPWTWAKLKKYSAMKSCDPSHHVPPRNTIYLLIYFLANSYPGTVMVADMAPKRTNALLQYCPPPAASAFFCVSVGLSLPAQGSQQTPADASPCQAPEANPAG